MHTNFKAFILTIVFWLLILSSPLESLGIDIGYIDELFVILLLPLLFRKNVFSKRSPRIWSYIVIFLIISFINSIYSEYFRGIELTILDLFLFLKPILFILTYIQISKKVRSKFLEYISYPGAIYIYLAFVFYIINIYYNMFTPHDIRFGLNAYSFIAANPGEFLNNLVLIGLAIYKNQKMKLRNINLVFIAFLLLTTLRFKAFVILIGTILLLYFFRNYNKRISNGLSFIKTNIYYFFHKYKIKIYAILGLALITGWSQFNLYFLKDLTPRLLLVNTSLQLGLKYFPFGVGAGTFGSAVAHLWYSPVYVDQGFRNYYGMASEGTTNFLNDNFWPMVYAQYGLIGIVLIILIYSKLLFWLSKNIIFEKYNLEIYLIIVFSIVISTVGSSILIGSLGILHLMILGAVINPKK